MILPPVQQSNPIILFQLNEPHKPPNADYAAAPDEVRKVMIRYIYKYLSAKDSEKRKFKDKLKDLVVEKKIWVPAPSDLNDASEFSIEINNCDQGQLDSLRGMLDEKGVLCFSASHKIELMWAHYGDGGKGICIQFEIDRNDLGKSLNIVNYLPRRPQMEFSEVMKLKGKGLSNLFLYSKSEEWRHEKEYRAISCASRKQQMINYKISAIILGYRTETETIDMVTEIAKKSPDKPLIYRAELLNYNDVRCFIYPKTIHGGAKII